MQPIGSVLKRAAAACVILSLLLACAPTVSADDDMASASMLSDGSSGTGTVNADGDQDDYWRIDLINGDRVSICLLYTSPSPRDGLLSRMPSSA